MYFREYKLTIPELVKEQKKIETKLNHLAFITNIPTSDHFVSDEDRWISEHAGVALCLCDVITFAEARALRPNIFPATIYNSQTMEAAGVRQLVYRYRWIDLLHTFKISRCPRLDSDDVEFSMSTVDTSYAAMFPTRDWQWEETTGLVHTLPFRSVEKGVEECGDPKTHIPFDDAVQFINKMLQQHLAMAMETTKQVQAFVGNYLPKDKTKKKAK